MGVSKDTARSAEDVISTPLPGETLAMFYSRSRKADILFFECLILINASLGEHWSQKAVSSRDNKGKQLRRAGFALAEERYGM